MKNLHMVVLDDDGETDLQGLMEYEKEQTRNLKSSPSKGWNS